MTPNIPRILLVEDDPDQAQLFTLILARDGYVIDTVPNAESALALLTETPVALLLVDWDLPEMKGDTLITLVKERYPASKTILYSNHAHVDQAAAACGADAWARKMDGPTQLSQTIARLLGK